MKTRIATSLGIAFVLVFGIVGIMVAFGPLGVQANEDVDIIAATDPDPVGNRVTGVKVEASPDKPNTVAKWTIEFMNGTIMDMEHVHTDLANTIHENTEEADNVLKGGTGNDTIMIEFEDDVQFPTSLDPNDITISTDKVAEADGTSTPRVVVANPLGVNITKVSQHSGREPSSGTPPDETLVTLEIPDMEPADDRAGSQGIAAGATVTVVFRQSAGIKNPTESKENEISADKIMAGMYDHDSDPDTPDMFDIGRTDIGPLSGYNAQVATSNNDYYVGAASDNRAVIPRTLVLNDQDGPRGSTITIVGTGFRNSLTATIWNDKNANGLRDGGEIELGEALTTSSDDFTTTITINNPPFTSVLASNGINAVDGRNRTIIPGRTYEGAVSGAKFTESIPKYKLESSIRVNPGTAAIGDRVQVTARDFLFGGAINQSGAAISIGGIPVLQFDTDSVTKSGDASFEMTIPNRVASGTQNLVVKNVTDQAKVVNTGGARFNMVISGAQVTITPGENLVPNQTVTLVGRGFSTGGKAVLNDDVANVDATISGDDTHLGPADDKFNEGDVIDVDNAGNWSSSFIIPVTSTTTTSGDHELSLTDSLGRSGSAVLNIAERSLELTPASGRVGTRVEIRGTGFPADNTTTGAESTSTITVEYSIPSQDPRTVVTLTPDGSGVIRGWFTVPLDAGIPSTNAVRAIFKLPGTSVEVTTNAIHQVPRAGITLDQESGPAGTVVKITGEGFKRYTTVEAINFGSLDVRSGFGLSTDGAGGFETTFLVPGANTGAQAVTVEVAETTASATFTVTADAVVAPTTPAAAPMAAADALAPLIANENNLVRVWQFDASKQNEAPDFGWSLYDPRPLFADANTIEMVEGGKFYWVNVQNEQTAMLGGKQRTLYAGWNPVTW